MISVVMPVYREDPAVLKQSVDAMLNQTYGDFELLIVLDDPDNQELIDFVRSYKDDRIRFLINPENLKLARSLNRAIGLAKGDIIARIDADDISEPTRLEEQLNFMNDGDYDFIGSLTSVIDDSGKTLFEVTKLPETSDKIKKALRYGQCLAHSTWMVRKPVYEDLEGYRMVPLCEDFDFTLRASLAGCRLGVLNRPLVRYRMSEGSLSRKNLFRQYLYMLYLTGQYRKGLPVSVEEADSWVNSHFDENQADAYYRANTLFNEAMASLRQKKAGPFLGQSVQLLFASGHYLEKIIRSARITMLS